ncbi:MAG: DsbA family protein [Thermoanaerobaculia bacterium]
MRIFICLLPVVLLLTPGWKEKKPEPTSSPGLKSAPSALVPLKEGRPQADGDSPSWGSTSAKVHIHLFTNFQCTMCGRSVEPLKRLLRAHPDDLYLVLRHNPPEKRTYAAPAAAASLAAFRQGKFWAFHDATYQERALTVEMLVRRAVRLGMDETRFRQDMNDAAVRAQVRSEIKLARDAGVTHKLTFVINGLVVEGWEDDGRLEDAVTLALGDADKLIDEGLPSEEVARVAMQRGSPISKRLAALLE